MCKDDVIFDLVEEDIEETRLANIIDGDKAKRDPKIFEWTLHKNGCRTATATGVGCGFTCVKCRKPHAYYSNKEFICTECHTIEKIEAERVKCNRCGKEYNKYTWFDPDCCPHCGKNFVD